MKKVKVLTMHKTLPFMLNFKIYKKATYCLGIIINAEILKDVQD